ncbi:hypothetical protein [Persicitalea jodogahamensis]|uniref:Uncharacterized protein n=1 Tax=Persicitalea jodogahamensis TaxID=402147 RepID=A0A8J3GBC9_9BACT|nr:hypothetical protein [Persicitalea jodogahamensis]GHB80937.1 hypothetical protein GCM10007390_39470 [Persicitalea jodogahamensis]
MAENEKSLGRKLLSFFIKDPEDIRPAPRPSSATKASGPIPAQPEIVNKPESAPISATAEVDRKFVEHFAELLEKANLPGPDYFEFKQSLKSMEGLGLSEEKQFQASWASFKAMALGITDTSVLTSSANHYGNVLNKDRESFLKDVEKAIDDRIGSLKQESKKLHDNNTSYSQQILDLQKKIDENNGRLDKINDEVQEQTEKINSSRASFDLTYQSMVDQINADIEKINRYLK